MTRPVRLQLRRFRGYNLQAHSIACNGLPAVNVARPSKWGNPWRVAPAFESESVHIPAVTAELAVSLLREQWIAALDRWPSASQALDELRGKNLACWCSPAAPCHADVLLELANAPRCEPA